MVSRNFHKVASASSILALATKFILVGCEPFVQDFSLSFLTPIKRELKNPCHLSSCCISLQPLETSIQDKSLIAHVERMREVLRSHCLFGTFAFMPHILGHSKQTLPNQLREHNHSY